MQGGGGGGQLRACSRRRLFRCLLCRITSSPPRMGCSLQVTGLPPVTKEWFEARKAQLASGAAGGGAAAQVWIDPLTKKKFMSENTYQAYTRSKKYLELVKKSGEPAPAPLIMAKPTEVATPAQAAAGAAAASGQGEWAHACMECGLHGGCASMLLLPSLHACMHARRRPRIQLLKSIQGRQVWQGEAGRQLSAHA